MSKPISRRAFASLALVFAILYGTGLDAKQQLGIDAQGQTVLRRPMPQGRAGDTLAFVRTELFFGTAKPDGVVTDAEFRAFIDEVVTPRFPDGLTVLKGDGQFRGSDGVIVKEASFLLILLYPVETQRVSSRRIERIRELYKTRFQQESVLRVDDPRAVRVSF
jgi:hypothetical protein